jgi:MFS transporter, NNP family, nitrate/nitrite transporter
MLAIEVKLSATVRDGDVEKLKWLREQLGPDEDLVRAPRTDYDRPTVNNPAQARAGIPGLTTVLPVVSVLYVILLARSVMSPLLLDIERAFGVSHGEVATIFVAFTVGYSLTFLFSGFVAERITHRWILPFAAAIGAAGLGLVAVAPTLAVLQLALAIFGIGQGLYVPSGLNVITASIDRRRWQKTMSIWELAPHLSMVSAPLLVLALRPTVGWRGVYFVTALLLALGAVLFALTFRTGDFHGSRPSLGAVGPLLRHPQFWLLIALFSIALGAVDGIYLLIPAYLITEVGIDHATANILFGASRILPIAFLLLTAVISDRLGPIWTIVISLTGTGLATMTAGISTGIPLMAAITLQPSLGAIFFPAGLSLLSAIMPERARNVAYSLVIPPALVLGTGILPAFIAHLGDVATFAAAFVGVGSVMAGVGILVAIRFRKGLSTLHG